MALTKIKTDAISDDAVTLAKQAAGTDGQIITYDASGNPTAVGPGTDGQVLTSTGAGSPPAFETISIPAGTTINNNANNRVITGSGTANTLEGEATLTFDGSNLTQTTDGDGEGIIVSNSGNTYNQFTFDANRSGADAPIGAVFAKWNGNVVGSVQWNTGADTTNKDDGYFDLRTTEGGTNTERVRVHQGGNVEIKTGNLIIGTSGKGIDFSATGDSGATGVSNMSEVLDDYEEGDWDPTLPDSDGGVGSQAGWYVKIGKMVIVQFSYVCLTNSDSSGHKVAGFPFPCNGYSEMMINSEANMADNGLCLHMTIGQSYGHIKNQENDEKTYANFNNCQVWGSGTYMTSS